MRSAGRRCVLPLAVALLLLGSAACGNGSARTPSALDEPSVDSSDTRAHRLMNLVARSDTLSTLAQALRQTGLANELRQGGPYTLFAPTDRAFQKHWPGFDSLLAPAGTSGATVPSAQNRLRRLSQPGSDASAPFRDSLRTVLQFHLVRGRFTAARLADSLRLETLVDESVLLERRPNGRTRLRTKDTPAPVLIRRTLEAQNGVLHVLPRPLRPPSPDTSSEGALRPSDTTGSAGNSPN